MFLENILFLAIFVSIYLFYFAIIVYYYSYYYYSLFYLIFFSYAQLI